MKSVGFIDHYLDNWHANKYPAWLASNLSGVPLKVGAAYGVIDKPNGVSNETWCKEFEVHHCRTIEEVIERSDYLIVLAPDSPEMHRELCELPLRSGKPTYVDKTFAPNGDVAREIIAMAKAGKTPFFSSSALRFCEEFGAIPFLGKAEFVRTHGSGNWNHYTVHQLEMISALMGSGVKQVRASLPMGVLQVDLDFGDGRRAALSVGKGLPFGYYAVPAEGEAHWKPAVDSAKFFPNLIATIATFFSTGHPPVDSSHTQEIMSIIGTIPEALETHNQWLPLS